MYEFSAIISNSVSHDPYDYHIIMLICGSRNILFIYLFLVIVQNSCTAYYFVENVIKKIWIFLMIRKLNYLP